MSFSARFFVGDGQGSWRAHQRIGDLILTFKTQTSEQDIRFCAARTRSLI